MMSDEHSFYLINLIVLIYIKNLMGNCSATGEGATSRSLELDMYLQSIYKQLYNHLIEHHGAR
jgi:hypothetical protein